MTHAVDGVLVFNVATSILYVLLGAWVLTLTPRRRQTTLLALFAATFGLAFLVGQSDRFFHALDATTVGLFTVGIGTTNGLFAVLLACAVPDRLEDRRLAAAAVAVGLGFSSIWVLSIRQVFGPGPTGWALALGNALGVGGLYAAAILVALRARPARGEPRSKVVQWALLGVAFAVLFAFLAGAQVRPLAGEVATDAPFEIVDEASFILPWVTVAGIWLWNMVRAGADTVRVHRAVALTTLGALAGGMLYFTAVPGADAESTVMRGVMRTLGVGLLAYGVLRHDLAGLDEKLEFGVSRTTVAGVFVAVFFVVSEGAQILLAGFAGSELLGVLAAGALVFFLAPIQRAADQLAARAVPGGASPADREGPADAEATYRAAVRAALRGGEVSSEDRRHLAEVARNVGLDPVEAEEIQEAVRGGEGHEQAGGDG